MRSSSTTGDVYREGAGRARRMYPILDPSGMYPILDPNGMFPILDPNGMFPILDPSG